MLTHLSDLHAKQPLSLVEENTLTLAVLEVLHHPPDLIGCLSSLTKVGPPSKPCHNHLTGERNKRQRTVMWSKHFFTAKS